MTKRILVIDDERDMQVYLRTLFQREGYEVQVARDGEEGLIKAKDWRPDLITLDIMMPRKSGVIAYERLRAAEATKSTPVVVVTGVSKLEGIFDDLPEPDAIVDKPIDREPFLERVAEIIGE